MHRLTTPPAVNLYRDGVYYDGRPYAVKMDLGGREITLSVDSAAPIEQIIAGVWEAAAEAHRRIAGVMPVIEVD